MGILLFISVLLVAACGLIYELVAGTLASYLLGDSVLQFSTVIGTYLFAMGIGSALSRYLNRGLRLSIHLDRTSSGRNRWLLRSPPDAGLRLHPRLQA